MAPKRFNVLNALRFVIKRFNECVTSECKSALRRFECWGSLNSAGNVGKRVGTFGKFTRNSLVACPCFKVTYKCLRLRTSDQRIFLPEGDNTHTVSLPPSECHTRCSETWVDSFWCFLLADLSVGVHTAARAPLCPLFCRNSRATSGKESPADC